MTVSEKEVAPEGLSLPGSWCRFVELKPGQTLSNELGGLRLWVTLLHNEWQLRTERFERVGEDSTWHQDLSFVVPNQDKALQRFVHSGERGLVQFRPALADRSIVIRPYNPIHIPPESHCTIYLSTVLWIQILVGDEKRQITEMPVMKPSWTWLGRNTMEGELCYASQTYARLMVDALPKRAWRAITPVHIENLGKEPLALERFSLPAPLLPLFQQSLPPEQRPWLWTPAITVTCEKNLATASLDIASKPPEEAGECHRVADAREKPDKGSLVRHIDRFFG